MNAFPQEVAQLLLKFYDPLGKKGNIFPEETAHILEKILTRYLGEVYNAKDYGAIGDGVTDDTQAIQDAINAAITAGGGTIFFPLGTYKVNSTGRTDGSVSYSGGTWTDSSITTNDVGSYVLGTNINNAEVPKITSVIPGVSFTTDVAPTGSVSSQNIIIVKPVIVLPPGIILKGAGAAFAQSDNSNSNAVAKIVDHGSGITVLIRGGAGTATQAIRYGMEDISFQGNNNSTMYGLYIGNFAWFLTARNCDFSHHGVAGIAADGNVNSDSFYDCTIRANGKVGATTFSGGVIVHPFYLQASSSLNFYNCFFEGNFGWGIVDGQSKGAAGVGLFQCQFNDTSATAATDSGVSAALTDHAQGADAKSFIVGGWSESAALYDLDIYGSPTIMNFTLASANITNHMRVTGGTAQLIGCRFENLSGIASIVFGSGGNITWNGCTCNDGFFFSGCGFDKANIPPFGMSNDSSGGFQLGSGNCIRLGSGAPGAGLGIQGDFYFRKDGSAGSSIYLKTGSSTWTAMA